MYSLMNIISHLPATERIISHIASSAIPVHLIYVIKISHRIYYETWGSICLPWVGWLQCYLVFIRIRSKRAIEQNSAAINQHKANKALALRRMLPHVLYSFTDYYAMVYASILSLFAARCKNSNFLERVSPNRESSTALQHYSWSWYYIEKTEHQQIWMKTSKVWVKGGEAIVISCSGVQLSWLGYKKMLYL